MSPTFDINITFTPESFLRNSSKISFLFFSDTSPFIQGHCNSSLYLSNVNILSENIIILSFLNLSIKDLQTNNLLGFEIYNVLLFAELLLSKYSL